MDLAVGILEKLAREQWLAEAGLVLQAGDFGGLVVA